MTVATVKDYSKLTGDWGLYYKIASYFVHKVKYQDREDFLHDVMLEMAKVRIKYQVKGKPLTEAGLMRVASYEFKQYWIDLLKNRPTIISLNTEIDDGEGNITELSELIADDKAIDLDAWLDAKIWLLGCPSRLIAIGCKRVKGKLLNHREQLYLSRWRQKELAKAQKSLNL